MSSRIASNTTLNCASYLFSISKFTRIARSLLRTLDNIATPCSVNARGWYLRPPHLEMPNWHLKFSASKGVNTNMIWLFGCCGHANSNARGSFWMTGSWPVFEELS
jgi:hypothetical protein